MLAIVYSRGKIVKTRKAKNKGRGANLIEASGLGRADAILGRREDEAKRF